MLNRCYRWCAPWYESGLRFIHYHAALNTLLIAVLALVVGFSSGWWANSHYTPHAGFVPTTQQPPPIVFSGSPPPASFSLGKWVTHVHQQGSSNSCVGQTLSTIVEIERAQAGYRTEYSATYIWSRLNGGQNVGISYPDAFALLQSEGDAPQSAVAPLDPARYYGAFYPTPAQKAAAYPQHASTFRSIALYDQYTVESEIAAGHPVAFAAPWDSAWENHFGSSAPLPFLSSATVFWHSVALISYDQTGVTLLNSWGPEWGNNGRAVIPWSVLRASGGFLEVSTPSFSLHKPKPHFPVARWESFVTAHHKPKVGYWHYLSREKGHIMRIPWVWWRDKGVARAAGAPRGPEHWLRKHHVMKQYFQRRIAYLWLGKKQTVRFLPYPRHHR